MSGLKQELGLAQGIGLLSTSLLGTGVFAVPALAALVAGNNSLWAWPVLIILVFPIAIVFAILGRHYPSAGIISVVFIYVAYQPGVENQTASSLAGISSMETLLPALFHLLLAFTIRACKLNTPMMARIASDLRTRHVQP